MLDAHGRAVRLALALAALAAALTGCGGPPAQSPASSPAAGSPASPALTVPLERQGTYGRHSFVATKNGDTAVAVFSPFLPRDDAAFLGGASAAAQLLFDTPLVPKSARLTADGEVAVAGQAGGTFYLFPVKEDTGEVHSIRLRRGP